MIKNTLLTSRLVVALFAICPAAAPTQAAPSEPSYRVVQSAYQPGEMFVAAYSVKEFGAKGDGLADDTASFQSALNAAAAIGGGTVYAPTGRYRINGSLTIPTNVSLRGQWRSPKGGKPVAGTVLMAYAGRGQDSLPQSKPSAVNPVPGLLVLSSSSSVRDLSIWYPEQKATAIVPYAPAVLLAGIYCTVRDIDFVNAYRGVDCALDGGDACYYIRNVVGSPLNTGVEIDAVADIGRLEHIEFAPGYWASSGLPDSPTVDGPQAAEIARSAIGILMRRNDWSYADDVAVTGYSVGFRTAHTRWGEGGYPNGYCDDLRFTRCGIGVSYEDGGVGFSRLKTVDCGTGIYCSSRFGGSLKLIDGVIEGRTNSLCSRGRGTILVQHSIFSGGPVSLLSGAASLIDSRFGGPAPQIALVQRDGSISLLGDVGTTPLKVSAPSGAVVKMSAAPRTSIPVPALSPTDESGYHASRDALYIVPRPAAPDTDETSMIQALLSRAGANGGGIVYLPSSDYTLKGTLTVPSGVELCGSAGAWHDTIRPASVLFFYSGRGNDTGPPAIKLASHAGLRGVTIGYPEQLMDNLAPYPPTIQLSGSDAYAMDIGAVNPWSLFDVSTYRCDRHYIARITGSALRHGFTIGGHCIGGRIEDCQQNSGAIAYGTESWRGGWAFCPTEANGHNWQVVSPEQFQQFDNYRLGDCVNEVLYNDFCFNGARGLTLGEGAVTGPSGVSFGTAFDQNTIDIDVHRIARTGFPIVNGQFCCVGNKDYPRSCYIHTAPEFTGTVSMLENDLFGNPGQAALLEGGSVALELCTISGAGSTAFVPSGGRLFAANLFLEQPSKIATNDGASSTRIAGAVFADGVVGPPALDAVDGAIAPTIAHGSAIDSLDMLGGKFARATAGPSGLSWRLGGLAPGPYRFELLTGDGGGDGPTEFVVLGGKRKLDVWPNDSFDYDLGTSQIAAGDDAVVTTALHGYSRLTDASVRAVPIPSDVKASDVAAWSILDEPPIDCGLVPIMKTDEGYATPLNVGGRSALRVPAETRRASSGPFLYFNVEDPRLNSGAAGQSVTLLIEYFDQGQGDIGVQYDAGEGDGFRSGASVITLTNSQTWKTGTIVLAHPQFANRTNGHDFRIGMPAQNPPAIATVALIKAAS